MHNNQVVALKSKSEPRPITCEYAGGCFRLNEKGLAYIAADKDGQQAPPRWICSPIHVVAKTRDTKRLIFAISTAFAPTLAKLVGEDSGGFHLRGTSSSGKTTALRVAASVWGRPEGYCRLWRSTANGLEGLASLHNDGLLILDELSQIDPKEAGEAAYLLANGQGKTRASRHGTAKASSRWSLLFLSAGQEIRLADIEADAGLAWLRKVVTHHQTLTKDLPEHLQRFMDYGRIWSTSGQISRVAKRFGLVAAAGELATEYGLTGWDQGEATEAAHTCFKRWLENFGTSGNREERAMLSQVRVFFESYGASRFDSMNSPNNEKIQNRAGFYRTDEQGFRVFLVLAEVFKNEVCQGFDAKTVARVLINEGWIQADRDGSPSQKPRVKGVGTPRLYVFTNKIWDGE